MITNVSLSGLFTHILIVRAYTLRFCASEGTELRTLGTMPTESCYLLGFALFGLASSVSLHWVFGQ